MYATIQILLYMPNADHNLQCYIWSFVSMDKHQLCKTVLKDHTFKLCK